MSQSLVPVNLDLNQLSTQIGAEDDFADLSKGTAFLGRLQLYTKGSAVNRKLIGPGEFGIPDSDEQIIGLGETVDILPLARRPKAIDLSDKEAIITVYDAQSDVFRDIAARTTGQDSGCMYGVSFLVIERKTGRLLEFFCGTKSTRPEAGKIAAFLPLSANDIERKAAAGVDVSNMEPHGPIPCSMKSKLIEKGKFSWHVPVVLPCSTPFTKMPKAEAIYVEVQKFLNPSSTEVEKAPEPDGKKKRAR